MTHYLMLRFFPGTFDETIYRQLHHLLRYAVPQECKAIQRVEVMRNAVSRSGNYGLIASFCLPDVTTLETYLSSDAHKEIIRLTDATVESRASIDAKQPINFHI